jgi:hypothetical protein
MPEVNAHLSLRNLDEIDEHLWLEETIKLLQAKQL